MGYAQLHPNWERTPVGITDGFSLEMTARDIGALHEARR
jgi:methylenetetrahydrofolate reductase (NADPH)